MEYSLQDFVQMFNDGELDVERYFNDYKTFFNILAKKNLLSELDPMAGYGSEHWQNQYLLWAMKHNKEKFMFWVNRMADDIEFDENGNAYFVTENYDKLSSLFCNDYRDGLRIETIESILLGDLDWYDYFSNTTDDVYKDVIDELTPKNIERLKERIIEELKDEQLSTATELMEEIAIEQGHPEYWTIDASNVARIIDDEESMNSLLDDELSDLESELRSVHNNAYNNAYESELYDLVWNKLDDYFKVDKREYSSRPHKYKKDTSVEYLKIPIRDFYGTLGNILSESKDYGNSGTLEYHGSYVGYLADSVSCLSIYPPDYPNPSLVDKNINEYFSDYI